MKNDITLEQTEQWAKTGVPIKDFSKDGSAVVLVSLPYEKNFEDALDVFFRILRFKDPVKNPVPIKILGPIPQKETRLLLIRNGSLVGVYDITNLILQGELASGLQTIPGISTNDLADILEKRGRSIFSDLHNG